MSKQVKAQVDASDAFVANKLLMKTMLSGEEIRAMRRSESVLVKKLLTLHPWPMKKRKGENGPTQCGGKRERKASEKRVELNCTIVIVFLSLLYLVLNTV